jgi:gamma-glutamyltranspeptidase/glutathione hydrolase
MVANLTQCGKRGLAFGLLGLTVLWASQAQAQPTPLPLQVSQTSWDPAGRCHDQRHAAVATAHPLATRVAMAALAAGGNAVDALVAASFALSVVVPQSTGIGGGGFAVVVPADGKHARAFDFRETAPAAAQLADYLDEAGHARADRSRWGGASVAVPGYVAGLALLHARYGKRPWASLVLPAAEIAEQGFVSGRQLAQAVAWVEPHLNPAARQIFAPGGKLLQAGDVVRMPQQAATLRAIAAHGSAGFYDGAVAADLVATVQAAGGRLSLADLRDYRVRELAPLEDDLAGGLHVWTMPQPSAGGAQVLAMAALLAGPDARLRSTPHALVEAMRRSFLLRLAYAADASKPARTLGEAFPRRVLEALGRSFDPLHATPSASLQPVMAPVREGNHTSHVSIVDGDGLAVSATHTVNLLLGSGLVAPASGVLLNDEMDDFTFDVQSSNAFGLAGSKANLMHPGARPVSSMSPLVVHRKPRGRPRCPGRPQGQATEVWVLGTPGGTRIPTVVLQILVRALAGETLASAVAAARLHHQAWPDQVELEEGAAGEAWVAELQGAGHTVIRKPAWCNAQAVHRRPGLIEAVSDPRGEGGAAAR